MAQLDELFSQPLTSNLFLYLPLFGFVILIVVLFALLFQREKMIVPGSIAGIIIFLTAAVIFEYSTELRSAIEKYRAPEELSRPAEPEPAKVAEVTAPAPGVSEEPPMEVKHEPIAREPKRRLVPVDRSILDASRPKEDKGGGLSIIREPARSRPAPVPVTPAPAPKPRPQPVTPAPAPQPVKPPVATPAPKPAPALTPKPVEPAPAPAPPSTSPSTNLRVAVASPSATTGNLQIEIKGPLLEISKTHDKNAHLMIILDGKLQQVIPPTRYREDFVKTDMGEKGEVTSVTYFWENVVITFENLQAGPHSVMIDTALMGSASHRGQMIGPANLKNDWNGFVDVRAGQTTQLVFGGKNWMTQQLDRLR
jgi:hypothetical protein